MKKDDQSGYVANDTGYVDQGQYKLRNQSYVSFWRNVHYYIGHHRRRVKHQSW